MLLVATMAVAVVAAGCAIGPNYHRPSAPTPQEYSELGGWKPITPKDTLDRGAWWSVYGDPDLDRLETQVSISNQNVKAYEAQYAQALALVRVVRSELFPSIGVNGQATRGRSASAGLATGAPATAGGVTNAFQADGTASWTLDVWGSIRRQLESQKAAAQVSGADLANALLSAQATLASDYFSLRAADALTDILAESVTGYERTAQITENQYHFGTASRGDFMAARAQVEATRAQLIALRQTRGQYEHAIAVLTGALPSGFTIAHGGLAVPVPVVPVGVPSALLERNPSIAAAERQMQSQSALIGVAEAAFFPDVTLSGLVGFASSTMSHLVSAPNRVWSASGTVAGTVLDVGGKVGAVAAARAGYAQAVANYRQTVLSTFQTVEDQLLALHTLQDEAVAAKAAVDAAQEAADVALNEYKAGTVIFTTVIVANQTYLADRQALLTIQQNRLLASVALIQVLGGGWESPRG
ncbi:MAG TPA: efflux transporter outer membrane subunit [Steroidobacteraceae bacterium]|nr:efflux transporter outer membrane subunit [Steroidobacteraceae bacterium]